MIASQSSSDRFFDSAILSKREAQKVKLDNIPGMGVRYVRWIVTGSGPFTVDVVSVKGGTVSKTVEK